MLAVTPGDHSVCLSFGFYARILLMYPAHDESTLALALSNKESFGFLSLVLLEGSPSSSCSVVSSSSPPVFCFLEDISSPTLSVNCLSFYALLFPSRPIETALYMVGTESETLPLTIFPLITNKTSPQPK